MIAREPVFAALFALLQGAAAFTTSSRRLVNVQDLAAEAFPAAYQLQGKQIVKKAVITPPIYEMEATWIIYALSNDPNIAPSTVLNPLVDAVLKILLPGPLSNALTLGGLVTQCAVSGDIDIFEGVLGDRAVAVIPLQILAPGF